MRSKVDLLPFAQPLAKWSVKVVLDVVEKYNLLWTYTENSKELLPESAMLFPAGMKSLRR